MKIFFTLLALVLCVDQSAGGIGIGNHVSNAFDKRIKDQIQNKVGLALSKLPEYDPDYSYYLLVTDSDMEGDKLTLKAKSAREKNNKSEFTHQISISCDFKSISDKDFNLEIIFDKHDPAFNTSNVGKELLASIGYRNNLSKLDDSRKLWLDKLRKGITDPQDSHLESVLAGDDLVKIRQDYNKYSKLKQDWPAYIDKIWGENSIDVLGCIQNEEGVSLFFIQKFIDFPIICEAFFPTDSEKPLAFITSTKNSKALIQLRQSVLLIPINSSL